MSRERAKLRSLGSWMGFAGRSDQLKDHPKSYGLSSVLQHRDHEPPLSAVPHLTAPDLLSQTCPLPQPSGDGLHAADLSVGQGLQSKGLVPPSPTGCSLSRLRSSPGTAQSGADGNTTTFLQSPGTADACPILCSIRALERSLPRLKRTRAALQVVTSTALQARVWEQQPDSESIRGGGHRWDPPVLGAGQG